LPPFLNTPVASKSCQSEKLFHKLAINAFVKSEIVKGNDDSKEEMLFQADCKPFLFKNENGKSEWVPRNKSVLVLKSFSNQKNSLTLSSEGTHRTLITSSIFPDTIFTQVSPKRLRIVLRDGNGTFLYLFQLENEERLKRLLQVLQNARVSSCKANIQAISKNLTHVSEDVIRDSDFIFESKLMGQTGQVYIKAGNQSISVGPCIMSIIRYGKEYIQSTRFIIRSAFAHKKVLDTSFLESNWDIRVVEEDSKKHPNKDDPCSVILRIFGSKDIDYQFKIPNPESFTKMLRRECDRAHRDEEYRLVQLKKEQEVQRMEEEAFNFSLLKSLFESQVKETEKNKMKDIPVISPIVSHPTSPLMPQLMDMDTLTSKPIEMSKKDSKLDDSYNLDLKQIDLDNVKTQMSPTITHFSTPVKVEICQKSTVKIVQINPNSYTENHAQKYENNRNYNRFISLLKENIELQKQLKKE
jgi:hypothetical protein